MRRVRGPESWQGNLYRRLRAEGVAAADVVFYKRTWRKTFLFRKARQRDAKEVAAMPKRTSMDLVASRSSTVVFFLSIMNFGVGMRR